MRRPAGQDRPYWSTNSTILNGARMHTVGVAFAHVRIAPGILSRLPCLGAYWITLESWSFYSTEYGKLICGPRTDRKVHWNDRRSRLSCGLCSHILYIPIRIIPCCADSRAIRLISLSDACDLEEANHLVDGGKANGHAADKIAKGVIHFGDEVIHYYV